MTLSSPLIADVVNSTRSRFVAHAALAAFAIALIARAVAALLFADIDPATAQLWEYGEQARCAVLNNAPLCLYKFAGAHAQPYPSAFMPPLLSYLWWGLFTLLGVTSAAIAAFLAINVIVGAACAPLVYRLTRQLGLSAEAGFAAALLLALYPSFVFIASTTHNTNFAVFFFLALASLAADLARRPNLARAALFGLAAGLATLNRSEMLIIAPALAIAAGAFARQVRTLLLAIACMAVVIAPWAARNEALFGAPIPTAQSAGYNLWKGFAPGSDGSGEATEADPTFTAARAAVRAETPVGPTFEKDVDAAYMAKARAALADMSPVDHARLAALKVAKLWTLEWSDPVTMEPLYIAPWLLANLLALIGLASLWRQRAAVDLATLAMIVLVLGGLTGAHAATFVHARYRMHIEPFLFILAGAALADLYRRFVTRHQRRHVPL